MAAEARFTAEGIDPAAQILVVAADGVAPVNYEWGAIKWLCDMKVTPGSSQSIGYAFVMPGETNPEHRPHKHASIIVVPSGTPGMEIVRDISTMAHPDTVYGRPGNHAEPPPCSHRPRFIGYACTLDVIREGRCARSGVS